MNTPPALVGIVDDDESVRRSLKRLLKAADYAAEAFSSAEAYLDRTIFEGPICLVLDVQMPGLNGLGLQETLEVRGGCEEIVFITGYNHVPTCAQAMKNGAVDFLMKPFDAEQLIAAVQRALERARARLRKRAERLEARGRIEKLTPREFDVLRFVVRGLLNKEIATEMNTAEKTVKVHRGRVMQKIGVTSVPDLVRFSQRAEVSPGSGSV